MRTQLGCFGDEKTITVTFPKDYPAENLKGKDAEFDITVKQVKVETDTKVDEEFAKSLGLESLDKLKELLKGQLLLNCTAIHKGLQGVQVDPPVLLTVDIVESEFRNPPLQWHLPSFKSNLLGISGTGLSTFVSTGSGTTFARTLATAYALSFVLHRSIGGF